MPQLEELYTSKEQPEIGICWSPNLEALIEVVSELIESYVVTYDDREIIVSIGLGHDKLSQITKEQKDVLSVSGRILRWMKVRCCLSSDQNFSTIRVHSHAPCKVVLIQSIETPMPGKYSR